VPRWNLPVDIKEAPYPDSVIADPSSDLSGARLRMLCAALVGLQLDADGRFGAALYARHHSAIAMASTASLIGQVSAGVRRCR
jgi:hypothetical protein